MPKLIPYIVGDVHRGRKFVNGVPLHRRGEREQMVREDFKQKLGGCTSRLFVQTGDLFDAFAVEEAVVLETAADAREAAEKNPHTTYVYYRGNHDASKDVTKASSFDVFAELMKGLPNVLVLKEPTLVIISDPKDTYGDSTPDVFGFAPWSPFKSSTELAYELVGKVNNELREKEVSLDFVKGSLSVNAVFGHWDTGGFGDDFNIVPTKVLKQITDTVYTGHVHVPAEYTQDGVKVIVTGSMQPYSHAEDPAGHLYITMPFAEYQEDVSDPIVRDKLANFNIRVLVRDGELAEPIDCLSFVTKKVTDKADDEPADLTVGLDEFNMTTLFKESLEGRAVKPSVSEQIMAKFQELRNASS